MLGNYRVAAQLVANRVLLSSTELQSRKRTHAHTHVCIYIYEVEIMKLQMYSNIIWKINSLIIHIRFLG
jgi:hypothetical protein